MKKISFLAAVIVFSFFLSGPVRAQDAVPAEKQALIKELIEMTGGKNIGIMFAEQMSQGMTAMLRQSNKDIPPEVIDAINDEIIKLFQEEMDNGSYFAILYPIYSEHLSEDDIRELIAFYKTPIGQKTIKVLPLITQESMVAGQQWGMSLGPKIQQRVQERLKTMQK